jgi:hypothetical protein
MECVSETVVLISYFYADFLMSANLIGCMKNEKLRDFLNLSLGWLWSNKLAADERACVAGGIMPDHIITPFTRIET